MYARAQDLREKRALREAELTRGPEENARNAFIAMITLRQEKPRQLAQGALENGERERALGGPAVARGVRNPTAETRAPPPSPAQWVKGSGVAAATVGIQSLAEEFPQTADVAIKLKERERALAN